MPLYSKSDLLRAKQNIKSKNSNTLKKIIKKTENFEKKSLNKKVTKWNFKVNELVYVKTEQLKLGLIVSDTEYFGKKIPEYSFLVLVNNKLLQLNGRNLKKI
jgi:hypothetical protein